MRGFVFPSKAERSGERPLLVQIQSESFHTLQQVVVAVSILDYKKAVSLVVGTAIIPQRGQGCHIALGASAACSGWEKGSLIITIIIAIIIKGLLEKDDRASH